MPDDGVDAADENGPDGKENEPETGAAASGAAATPGNAVTSGGVWGKRSVRAGAAVGAALVAAGIAVGVTTALQGSVPAAARIPTPPAKDAVFVEDDNGAGQDQQDNILQYSAPGVVTIRSGNGTDLGSGIVITRSGFVLAAYHGLQGSETLRAKLVMSGKTYAARLVGSDQEANLALLQLSGTGFAPVKIGCRSTTRCRSPGRLRASDRREQAAVVRDNACGAQRRWRSDRGAPGDGGAAGGPGGPAPESTG